MKEKKVGKYTGKYVATLELFAKFSFSVTNESVIIASFVSVVGASVGSVTVFIT